MSVDPLATRIALATETDALLEFGTSAAAALYPQAEVRLIDLDELENRLYQSDDDELLMLALHATADGELDPASPLVRAVMSAHVPVIVVRKPQDADVAVVAPDRVLVPLDGSATAGQAVPIARRAAATLDLPVKFVMVIDPARVVPPGIQHDPDAWDLIEDLRTTAHWALTQAEESLRSDGIEVTSELLYGGLAASLQESVTDTDLVVMTTHGLNRSQLRGRSSVTLGMLTSVSQPMLVMRASRQADVIEACRWVPRKH